MEQQVYGKWRCNKCRGVTFVSAVYPTTVLEAQQFGLVGKWVHYSCGGIWQYEEPIDKDNKLTKENSNENQG